MSISHNQIEIQLLFLAPEQKNYTHPYCLDWQDEQAPNASFGECRKKMACLLFTLIERMIGGGGGGGSVDYYHR